MTFYDSVKEHVRNENGDEKPDEPQETDTTEGEDVFDELRKGAEDMGTDADDPKQDDAADDGTDIEVLTEDGLKPADADGTPADQGQPSAEPADPAEAAPAAAGPDEVVALLETIEEQNREILSVLRSIDRSLQ